MAGTPADTRGVVVEKATSLGASADAIRDRFVPLQSRRMMHRSWLDRFTHGWSGIFRPRWSSRLRRPSPEPGGWPRPAAPNYGRWGLSKRVPDIWSRTAGPALLREETSRSMTPRGRSPGPWRGTGSCGCTRGHVRRSRWQIRSPGDSRQPWCAGAPASAVCCPRCLRTWPETDADLSAAGSARLADEVAELTITAALEAAHSVEDKQAGPSTSAGSRSSSRSILPILH